MSRSNGSNLMMKGGKPLRRLDRPVRGPARSSRPALIDVTDVRDRPDEEIFGPVLQLIRVKDFDAAIDEANNTRFGLAASLIGGSPEMYDKFWANVRAGVINWNKPTNGAPSNAPFGGIGLSRQPPPERLLRRRLLRLSGDQQRSRPRPRGDRRGPARPEHAGRLSLRGTAVDRFRGSPRSSALMSNSKWIGKALSLALCSTALAAACSARRAMPPTNRASTPHAPAAAPWTVAWNNKTEKQLRDAIAARRPTA